MYTLSGRGVTFPLECPTTRSIYDTLRSIIQRVIDNIHLCLKIYAMHMTSLQQPFLPFLCSIQAFILPLLEHYAFPSSFSCEGWGKNLPRNASTNSSYVSIEPYGNDSYHVAAISLKEKGNRCSFIPSGLTPFNLTVCAILDLPRCSLGVSVG